MDSGTSIRTQPCCTTSNHTTLNRLLNPSPAHKIPAQVRTHAVFTRHSTKYVAADYILHICEIMFIYAICSVLRC